MKYFLGQCEYKWTHANSRMEQIWIQRELGDGLYKTVESNNWGWKLQRSNSQTMPGDVYCRCDIYVEIPSSKQATHFVLKYPQAKQMEKMI